MARSDWAVSIAEIYQSSHKGVSNVFSLIALQHAKRTIFAGFGQIEREWKIQTEYGLNGWRWFLHAGQVLLFRWTWEKNVPKWNDGFEEDLKRCWRGIRDRLLKKQKQPPSDHDASLLFNLLPACLSEESRISLFIFSHYNRKNVDQFNLLRLCAAALSPSSLSHPPRPCLFHLSFEMLLHPIQVQPPCITHNTIDTVISDRH